MIMNPAVMTSKMAQTHMNDVKAQHNDLLTAMAMQKDRVQAFQQQKQVEQQNQQVMAHEMAQAKMVADTEAAKMATQQATESAKLTAQTNKDVMQHQQKTQELDIKRAALNSV